MYNHGNGESTNEIPSCMDAIKSKKAQCEMQKN